jgi:hypothetical protein
MSNMLKNRPFSLVMLLGSILLALLLMASSCEGGESEDDAPPPPDPFNCAALCDDVVEAVCDVNGKVYINRCVAECAGAEVDDSKECLPCRFEMAEYHAQGLQKVRLLDEYIALILNKGVNTTSPDNTAVDQAVDEAVELFVNEESQVAVSGTRTNYYLVRDYLERIKNYSYGRVEIKWSEIGYLSGFKKGSDGNYYGTVTVTQKFSGYNPEGEVPIYEDVTRKNVNIVLKTYTISRDGEIDTECEVYLSDIGVVDSRRIEG